MLIRIVVCLKVRGGLLVSKVQIMMLVFLRMYMDFPEKKRVWIIEIDLFG